jgi:hypothetical protein
MGNLRQGQMQGEKNDRAGHQQHQGPVTTAQTPTTSSPKIGLKSSPKMASKLASNYHKIDLKISLKLGQEWPKISPKIGPKSVSKSAQL